MDTYIAILMLLLCALIGGLLFFALSRVQDKTWFWKLFIFGAIGWTAAYIVRLPLIGILQYYGLLMLGVDISNSVEIAQYALHPLILIWGPLLSGPFEEGARYFCFTKNPNVLESTSNRKYSPLVLGIGWTTAEILVLVILPVVAAGAIGITNLLLVLWERIVATIFHITMGYWVIYAIFESENRRPSLWIAMIAHSSFNFVILIWIWSFRHLGEANPILYIITLEGAFTIFAIVLAGYTYKIHILKKEKMILELATRPVAPNFEDLDTEEQKKQVQIDPI